MPIPMPILSPPKINISPIDNLILNLPLNKIILPIDNNLDNIASFKPQALAQLHLLPVEECAVAPVDCALSVMELVLAVFVG